MLLLSNKKEPGAHEYRQRGLPRLVPAAAPARGGQGATQGRGQHASELGHTAEETEVLRTSGGAGDIGVLRTQRIESCGPAFFFKHMQKINTSQSSASQLHCKMGSRNMGRFLDNWKTVLPKYMSGNSSEK